MNSDERKLNYLTVVLSFMSHNITRSRQIKRNTYKVFISNYSIIEKQNKSTKPIRIYMYVSPPGISLSSFYLVLFEMDA